MTAPMTAGAAAAPARHSVLAVPGMRCSACIARIERGLGDTAGIIAARVNFSSRQVAVDHLPELDIPALKAAMAALGFEAEPIPETVVEGRDEETRALLRATAVAGFAAMNIMLLSVSVWSGAVGSTRDLFHLLSAMIAIPTVAYSGRTFFRSAWGALRRGRTNMDVPISIGVILVTLLSLYETLAHGPHAYFDGAVMLLFFLLIGRLLDSYMRDRARSGVIGLLRQTAAGARILDAQGRTKWLRADQLLPDMVMIVPAGERLAADGIVEGGPGALDLSLLTGESAPQRVKPGEAVHAGTLNLDGPLQVRISATGRDTAIADIARLMEHAAQGKSSYVRIADRAARLYAPAVHTLALLSFAGWLAAGAGWHQALMIAAAVLIITCPCALGLAVPAAQIVAAGTLMRGGVLVKDGSALERLAEVDRALFDKTGTLTLGQPQPVDLEPLDDEGRAVALALSRGSCHPLSQALCRALETQGVRAADVNRIEEVAGVGLRGFYRGGIVTLGRPGRAACDTDLLAASLSIPEREPLVLRFRDPIRPCARPALRALEQLGIEASIVSGDRAAAVAPVAGELGLTAQTGMSPADKLDTIARISKAGRKVLMVGDGLNDGPALAAGHASIAPASASDVGQNAADAVFLGDSLMPVVKAIRVARRTMAIVRQNFAIAIGYNALAIPLALAGYVTPLIAALAMSGSSIIVVGNALRLRSAGK